MRYNPDTNRYRGVDAHALGRLLDSDTPINCCGGQRREGGCGTRGMHGMPDSREGTCCMGGARLASACAGEPSLAIVYSPYQHFRDLYSPYEALCRGTLFRELDKPWKVGGCR